MLCPVTGMLFWKFIPINGSHFVLARNGFYHFELLTTSCWICNLVELETLGTDFLEKLEEWNKEIIVYDYLI